MVAGTQAVRGATAYCVPENCGVSSNEIDGEDSSVEVAGFTVMLSASNTVSIGTMHGTETPTLGSEQAVSDA